MSTRTYAVLTATKEGGKNTIIAVASHSAHLATFERCTRVWVCHECLTAPQIGQDISELTGEVSRVYHPRSGDPVVVTGYFREPTAAEIGFYECVVFKDGRFPSVVPTSFISNGSSGAFIDYQPDGVDAWEKAEVNQWYVKTSRSLSRPAKSGFTP